MKIEWHEDDFEIDEDLPEVKKTIKSDTLDKYNEEMARDAVSSLFDEDEETDQDDEPVVTGFDKPVSKSSEHSTMRAVKSEKERVPGPRVQDIINGDEVPPRKRDRTRESNPVPKPAVRYAPPPPRERKTVRTASVGSGLVDDYDEDIDGDVTEEMAAFRKRYKTSPPEHSHRSESTPRPRPERQVQTRSTRHPYDEIGEVEEDEPISPIRWVFTAAAIVLLGTIAFLAVQINTLSEQLTQAQAAAVSAVNSSDVTELQLTIEQMTGVISQRDDRIKQLEEQVDGIGAASNPDGPNFGLDNTPPNGGVSAPVVPEGDGAATSSSAASGQTYTVVSGDSLSKIAQKMYGSQSPSLIEKIMSANNMTNSNIGIGQILTIPPQ